MHEPLPIRCIIVDDEPHARQLLRHDISKLPRMQLEGECGNAIEALSMLQNKKIDLLFLDIHMPQLKGTELLKIVAHPPNVIFTTAHADYALEGYELNAIDYLLKPIKFERFLKAVNKLSHVPANGVPSATGPESRDKEQYIYLRSERKMVKVMLSDINYIESMKDYVKVFTNAGTIITKQSMASMEAMLPEDRFIRVHRSFIVSTGSISSYTNEMIFVARNEIPIGKLFRNSVLGFLTR
ncbi:MAG: two component transcriptional regulator, LytTR family [Chitinophagaceae bacterium]|jgi:DNA-binding LytR/AlgR family response regulator|nr:two component transcriptional regulator, LytTR family [Chitinophagaceae bacterium]